MKLFKNSPTLLLISYVVMFSSTKILVRYLTFYFDTVTLMFFRYLVGSSSLMVISYLFFRDDLGKTIRDRRRLTGAVVLGALWTVIDFLYVKGLSYTSATVASLMDVFGLLMGIGWVALVFFDERKTIKTKSFTVGLILAVLAVVGLNLSKGAAISEYSLGIYYLVAAEVLVGGDSLFKKRLVVTSPNPVCLSSLVSAFASIFFFIGALFFGDLTRITRVSCFINVVLFGSGICGLMIGAGLHFVCIKKAGLSKVNLISLSLPVFTGIFAYLFLKESLNTWQVLFAAILIGGCLLAIGRKRTAIGVKENCL